MAEYISRELVLDQATEVCYWCGYRDQYDEVVFLEDIEDIPAADVAPVRHGHWKWDGKHFYCSACAGTRYHDLVLGLDAAYCPYCGAKMDEEDD